MRLLGEVIWGLILAVLLLGILVLSSFYTPHAWLPVAYGLAFPFLISRLPTVREKGLGVPIGICFLVIVLALWLRSEGLLAVGPHRDETERITLGWAAVIAGAGALLALVWRVRLSQSTTYLPWLAVTLVLAALVAKTSNSQAGASPMVDWVMRHFHLSEHAAQVAVIAFRKTVHVCFYGVLGLCLDRSARQARLSHNTVARFALGACLLVASFDELRQSTQIGRSGSAWDVLLDMAGASLVVLVVHGSHQKEKSPASSSAKGAQ